MRSVNTKYLLIMMTKTKTKVALSEKETSLVDVLWNLYALQSDNVKEAFRIKIYTTDSVENGDETTKRQQEMVKESFTNAYNDLVAGNVKHDARKLFGN